jgi:hypothetical protein
MSTPLILLVTGIYVLIAADFARKGDWLGLTFAGYALANVGLVMAPK